MTARKPGIVFLVGGKEGGGSAASILQLMERIDRDRFSVWAVSCENGPFARRISAQGHRCDTLDTGWPPALREPTSKGTRPAPLGYVRWPFWALSTLLRLRSYVHEHPVDIIHTNYMHFHAMAAQAAKKTSCGCVWHWRAPLRYGAQDKQRGGPANSMRNAHRDLRWSAMRKCSGVWQRLARTGVWSIANSQLTADSVKPFAGPRLEVVYNGVELERGGSAGTDLRKLLKIGADQRIVGMVASLNPLKGHHCFLEAAKLVCEKHEDVHFVHIGGPTAANQGAYEQALLRRRNELGLADRVHFLGHRADAADLSGCFTMATVCTLPPGEGFGLVIVEAMVRGVAVVSTDQGAAREILTDGETGVLVPAADATALAAAIGRLLDDCALRDRIAHGGRVECSKRFDIRETVRRIETIYETMCRGRAR